MRANSEADGQDLQSMGAAVADRPGLRPRCRQRSVPGAARLRLSGCSESFRPRSPLRACAMRVVELQESIAGRDTVLAQPGGRLESIGCAVVDRQAVTSRSEKHFAIGRSQEEAAACSEVFAAPQAPWRCMKAAPCQHALSCVVCDNYSVCRGQALQRRLVRAPESSTVSVACVCRERRTSPSLEHRGSRHSRLSPMYACTQLHARTRSMRALVLVDHDPSRSARSSSTFTMTLQPAGPARGQFCCRFSLRHSACRPGVSRPFHFGLKAWLFDMSTMCARFLACTIPYECSGLEPAREGGKEADTSGDR